jgi:hypothetical protein
MRSLSFLLAGCLQMCKPLDSSKLPQASAQGLAKLNTTRFGIRYQGVSSSTRSRADQSIAGSPPYIVHSASRRSLMYSHAARPARNHLAGSSSTSQDMQQPFAYSESRKKRMLMDAQVVRGNFSWFDLQGDGLVNSLDSDAFFSIGASFNWRYSSTDMASYCELLDKLYNHDMRPGSELDEVMMGNGVLTMDSPFWQSVDPRLIGLRSDDSVGWSPGTACSSLAGMQQVPQLSRFDGTRPPTRSEFHYLVGTGSSANQRNKSNFEFDELLRPNSEDFRAYQVLS